MVALDGTARVVAHSWWLCSCARHTDLYKKKLFDAGVVQLLPKRLMHRSAFPDYHKYLLMLAMNLSASGTLISRSRSQTRSRTCPRTRIAHLASPRLDSIRCLTELIQLYIFSNENSFVLTLSSLLHSLPQACCNQIILIFQNLLHYGMASLSLSLSLSFSVPLLPR